LSKSIRLPPELPTDGIKKKVYHSCWTEVFDIHLITELSFCFLQAENITFRLCNFTLDCIPFIFRIGAYDVPTEDGPISIYRVVIHWQKEESKE
jgi:hypothetical protein